MTVPPVEMLSQHLVADEVLTAEKRLIVLCHPGPHEQIIDALGPSQLWPRDETNPATSWLYVAYIFKIWLVVWNMIFLTFRILGRIIPTDFHIFQRA